MIGSRLRRRRATKTITVKDRTHSGSTYSEARRGTLDDLTATFEQRSVAVADDVMGTYNELRTIFFFAPLPSGSLPAIAAGDVLIDEDDNRYEVRFVNALSGNDNRLMVETLKLEWAG